MSPEKAMFHIRVRKPGASRWTFWKGGRGLETTSLPHLAVDFPWDFATQCVIDLLRENPGVEIEARESRGPAWVRPWAKPEESL
jgi:hypothetical protein